MNVSGATQLRFLLIYFNLTSESTDFTEINWFSCKMFPFEMPFGSSHEFSQLHVKEKTFYICTGS